ncbi:hypothetical protein OH77DRAFT_1185317 [Trametes cingulata]|nr:hypothetical protein OH77DRAFT_1185317 [Trametes cingulata]
MSFVPGSSRVPAPRHLQGTRPGLLDSTQPERLLRVPGSTLTFAVFDPLAAAGNTAQTRRRKDADPARPKRIVIETPPGGRGQSRWRFVPRARRAPGIEDEGVWPRRVIICGEPCIMSEEQWDIYKLDPEYDCFIPTYPGDPIITRKDHPTHPPPPRSTYESYSTGDIRKHSSSPEPDGDRSPNIHKRFRKVVNLVTDEEGTELESETETDDEDEVEEIIADEFEPPRPKQTRSTGAAGRRKAQEARRKEQREKLKANMPSSSSFESRRSKTPEIVDLTMEDDSPPVEQPANGAPPPGPTKRKDPDEHTHTNGHGRPDKRPRMERPPEVQRKRTDRQRQRAAQRQERASTLREQRERRLWEEIIESTPKSTPHGSQSSESIDGEPLGETQASAETGMGAGAVDDEEAARQAAIEESRRKLAELEKDRPLWEEEARRRAAKERAEEEARRARKQEERRRAAAAAAEEQRQRERAAAAAAEAEMRARAEKERIERERELRRRRERERWSYGPWTTVRAIERYKLLSEAFDAAKFTAEDPVMFETIPWPVLHSPVTLRVEDIDWSAVEEFFAAARRHMRPQDYKAFVEKSHKRFHPDRWRARGVLKSVADEELRGCLEVAANTVAQALTPIWREVRG